MLALSTAGGEGPIVPARRTGGWSPSGECMTKNSAVKISWVARTLRLVVFQERDQEYSRRLKRFINRYGPWYWVAYDVRSYQIGTGDTIPQAINRLIKQCHDTDFLALDEEARGGRVIRWRCLMPADEIKEAEAKARQTGFILDGVKLPPMPEKLRRMAGKIKWKTMKPRRRNVKS